MFWSMYTLQEDSIKLINIYISPYQFIILYVCGKNIKKLLENL